MQFVVGENNMEVFFYYQCVGDVKVIGYNLQIVVIEQGVCYCFWCGVDINKQCCFVWDFVGYLLGDMFFFCCLGCFVIVSGGVD